MEGDIIPVNDDIEKNPPNKTDKTVDKSKLLVLYFDKGMPEADIARYFNVSPQAINVHLKPFKGLLQGQETINTYRSKYPDILSSIELQLLSELVDKKRLKKANTGNIAYALDKITVHRRLHEGLPTDINATITITAEEALALRRNSAADADRIIREGSK